MGKVLEVSIQIRLNIEGFNAAQRNELVVPGQKHNIFLKEKAYLNVDG